MISMEKVSYFCIIIYIKSILTMKKFLTLLLMMTVASAGLFAQAKKDVKATGPVMNFKETTIDYGVIQQNDEPYREFHFTNNGSEPLLIKNAKGSCGCTVPEYSKDPIMPGESGILKVKYDTNRVGPINKTITVTTNEVANENRILYIKGEVKKKDSDESVPAPKDKGIFTNSPKG